MVFFFYTSMNNDTPWSLTFDMYTRLRQSNHYVYCYVQACKISNFIVTDKVKNYKLDNEKH